MIQGIRFFTVALFLFVSGLPECFSQSSRQFAVPEILFDPPSYVIYKAGEEIQVDGVLDEEAWKRADWTEDFADIRGGEHPAPENRTRAKLLWDDGFLYIGAEIEEKHIYATMTERDSPLHLDNAFEVFIDPTGDTHNYVEFQINALGTIWDLLLTKPYRDGGNGISRWNLLDYQAAVKTDGELNKPGPEDEKWIVELALPLGALAEIAPGGRPPEAGDQWRMNFSRAYRDLEVSGDEYRLRVNPDTGRPYNPSYTSWAPQGLVNIHYPEMWGFVQFSGLDAGTGAEEFRLHPEEQIKWGLRNVYYQMKEYYLDHGHFDALSSGFMLEQIGLEGIKFQPVVRTSTTMFEVSASGLDEETVWYINQEGKIWKEIPEHRSPD